MKRMQAWVMGAALAGFAGGAVTLLPAEVFAQSSQGQVWIQIEAKNSRARIEERLRHWSATLPNVNGFMMASGWYAAALGPYDRDEAAALLNELRLLRAIPSDSFIADGRIYRSQLEAVTAGALPLPDPISGAAGAPTASIDVAPLSSAPTSTAPVPLSPVETLAEARRAETLLSREERMDIQRALVWAGTLSGGVDGAFGPATRGAIGAWQSARSAEPTGVLTSEERRALVDGWKAEIAALGLQSLRDEEAGIAVDLPLGLVSFEAYAPPYAHYAPKNDSGLEIRLISQPGDQQTLEGLFAQIEASGAIPPEGPRSRRARGFDLSGVGPSGEGHAWAELSDGVIKGYLVTARREDAARTARVLQAMQQSFRSLDGQVLDPGLIPLEKEAIAAMLTGVERELPKAAGSGFFASAQGHIITAAALVEACGQITIDGGIKAERIAIDPAMGVALLRPLTSMAPKAVAEFSADLPAAGGEVAVAGYSYGTDLPLPSMTFGHFAAPTTLEGSSTRARLDMAALAGDIGGPVLGADGRVIGVLQGAAQDPARLLPAGVSYIAPASGLVTAFSASLPGLSAASVSGTPLAVEDLSRLGNDMAAQVLCWK